jgi:hypothetical protein
MTANTTYPSNEIQGTLVSSGYATKGYVTGLSLEPGRYTLLCPSGYLVSPQNFKIQLGSTATQSFPNRGTQTILLTVSDSNVSIFSNNSGLSLGQQGPISNGLNASIIWDGTNFYAAPRGANPGRLFKSSNFLNWETVSTGSTLSTANFSNAYQQLNLGYAAGQTQKYVWLTSTNAAAGAVWTSTDAVTWTSRTLPVAPGTSSGPYGLLINTNATNKYVLTANTFTNNQICYSTDAITWTQGTFTYVFNAITGGDTNNTASTNQIYVYGLDGTPTNATTSTDGVTWTNRNTGIGVSLQMIKYFDGKYYGFGSSTTTYGYSTDGVTWTSATLPYTSGTGGNPIIYDNKLWVNAGGSAWMYSTDGTSWSLARFTSNTLQFVTDGTNLFHASLTGGEISPTLPLYYKLFKV